MPIDLMWAIFKSKNYYAAFPPSSVTDFSGDPIWPAPITFPWQPNKYDWYDWDIWYKVTLIKLYKTFIQPTLEYGNIIWGPQDQQEIEKV